MSLQERLVSEEETSKGERVSEAVEPRSTSEAVVRHLHLLLLEEFRSEIEDVETDEAELSRLIERRLRELLSEEAASLSADDRRRVVTEVIHGILGFGPIQEFLEDPEVTEIMANSPSRIYVERFGKTYETGRRFIDEEHMLRVIDRLLAQIGAGVSEGSPMIDARLPDGSRVNAVIGPLALDGPILTVRKYWRDRYQIEDLIAFGTLTERAAAFLEACVRGGLNLVVSGGMASGRTTLLNVLCAFVPAGERIVTIEDAIELRLRQEHVLRLESRPPDCEGNGRVDVADLARNALRMRPDRIIVGEMRGAEVLEMLQAMHCGQEGVLTTVLASSPEGALFRIETMALMSGLDLPVRAIRRQIAASLDLIVHLTQLPDGARRVTRIVEIGSMGVDSVVTQDLFELDTSMGLDARGRHPGLLEPTGERPWFAEKLAQAGIDMDPDLLD